MKQVKCRYTGVFPCLSHQINVYVHLISTSVAIRNQCWLFTAIILIVFRKYEEVSLLSGCKPVVTDIY